jgi:serine/threonine-protein kinase
MSPRNTSSNPAGPTVRGARSVAPAEAAHQTSGRRTPLPPDVVADAARRLRAVALLYAGVFFVVGPLTALVSPAQRQTFFTSALRLVPSILSIGAAVAIAIASYRASIAPRLVLRLGLVFEVLGSYGIAAARYLDPGQQAMAPPGVSWVAVWILLFATVIPTPPRRALLAALASATAVPVVAGVGLALRGEPPMAVLAFAARTFVPYLLVALVAGVAARVVYRLGTELTHARELGSYRLVERLGQGGMGEVWRAEHHLLARPAAIKLIRTSDRDEHGDASELKARFAREAQVTSGLRSPHTIQLYDFGVTDEGAFYYVMELLDGFDLQVLVERFGPVPVDRAVHLLLQVCDSLAEAHDRGLIHRDIKPANVYVCRYGREVDFVKVLDFGLVKPASAEQSTTELALTGPHAAHGTPAFMAPEQALGNSTVDGRADLYALGCLAYWLVTGKPVFEGSNPIDTIVKHVNVAPDPPSRHARVDVPPEYDALVLACLSKGPDQRPSSADDVAKQLGGVATFRGWTRERARGWWDTVAARPSAAVESIDD